VKKEWREQMYLEDGSWYEGEWNVDTEMKHGRGV